MKIEHIAIWTKDIEKTKEFYCKYFNAISNEKYINHKRKFESYFLSFDTGCRLEIMQLPILHKKDNPLLDYVGLAHFAISVGSKEKVLELTETLRNDGYKIIGEPRTTGDGYFESVILDCDGNKIEITI
ncbi:MAG: lactoylglutathione lyase [Fusobacteriaceae bacterium]|nr:glyoxalase/bleomycin resistance protein/dioxygenase [Fusobacteriales bacterium]MDN5305142.1 lactoylglutathione lyase [Fusobacteriaceae bacterium]